MTLIINQTRVKIHVIMLMMIIRTKEVRKLSWYVVANGELIRRQGGQIEGVMI